MLGSWTPLWCNQSVKAVHLHCYSLHVESLCRLAAFVAACLGMPLSCMDLMIKCTHEDSASVDTGELSPQLCVVPVTKSSVTLGSPAGRPHTGSGGVGTTLDSAKAVPPAETRPSPAKSSQGTSPVLVLGETGRSIGDLPSQCVRYYCSLVEKL